MSYWALYFSQVTFNMLYWSTEYSKNKEKLLRCIQYYWSDGVNRLFPAKFFLYIRENHIDLYFLSVVYCPYLEGNISATCFICALVPFMCITFLISLRVCVPEIFPCVCKMFSLSNMQKYNSLKALLFSLFTHSVFPGTLKSGYIHYILTHSHLHETLRQTPGKKYQRHT